MIEKRSCDMSKQIWMNDDIPTFIVIIGVFEKISVACGTWGGFQIIGVPGMNERCDTCGGLGSDEWSFEYVKSRDHDDGIGVRQ